MSDLMIRRGSVGCSWLQRIFSTILPVLYQCLRCILPSGRFNRGCALFVSSSEVCVSVRGERWLVLLRVAQSYV